MVISGCQVSGNSISAGIVGLNGADGYKVCRFGGANNVSVYPVYLYQEKTEIKDQYDTGEVKAVQYVYEAKITNSLPVGDYVRLEANGTKKMFRDAMQSAAYRLVTDVMINTWNGIEGRAKTDATAKAEAAKTYAGQLADDTLVSAVQYANTKKSEAIATASDDATNKANSAINSALNTIRGTITTERNTLGKLYDWVFSALKGKASKGGDAYQNFYAAIGLFTGGALVNGEDIAVRVYGDRILCATNNGGSERPFGLNDKKTILAYPHGSFEAPQIVCNSLIIK